MNFPKGQVWPIKHQHFLPDRFAFGGVRRKGVTNESTRHTEIGNGLLESRTYRTSHTPFTLSVRKVMLFIYAYDKFCDKFDDEKES